MYFSACNDTADDNTHNTQINKRVGKFSLDTLKIRESKNEEDSSGNELLKDSLQLIRNNFKRINTITAWTKIYTKDLWTTGEGGEAKLYYKDSVLEKIVTRQYGETFQQLTEYYLLNGRLSFVFNKLYKYNRPIFFDSIAMKESGDTESFDFKKSTIIEDRSYFKEGSLFHQLNNGNSELPISANHLQKEQERMYKEFNDLLGQINK